MSNGAESSAFSRLDEAGTEETLTRIALRHGSDKVGGHHYTRHYEAHFARLRSAPVNLLEIGIGGYDDPDRGGASLRMWRDYFQKGNIFGVDVFDKRGIEGDRIRVFQGSQADPNFLKTVAQEMGEIDIVIDDGSHLNEHVIASFETLFPLLREGGIYAVEDTQTSYWPELGGDSFDFNRRGTSMTFFKGLADGLNFQEFDNPFYLPTYYDRFVTSVSFYHNLVFVTKGVNNEGSNAGCSAPARVQANRRSLRYLLRWLRSGCRVGR